MKRILFLALCALLLTFTNIIQAHPRGAHRSNHRCGMQQNRYSHHRMIKRMMIKRMTARMMRQHRHHCHRGWRG